MSDFWVFGYGSLMWNPGFAFQRRSVATLAGFHRRLCIRSTVYRGTPEHPGLVLGLDRGGICAGVAFHVAAPDHEDVLAYLREREQVNSVYSEQWLPLTLADGDEVTALTYVADRNHSQYAGKMTVLEASHIVASSTGKAGPNRDYVTNTVAHLRDMGIVDATLEEVASMVSTL